MTKMREPAVRIYHTISMPVIIDSIADPLGNILFRLADSLRRETGLVRD
jgi:hypothetical protein